ncbi:MAG TPA: hypothetical protein HA224_01820 [Nanoarchaeota archaeon]|nr:hypothetical protein [Nanoarchaeota archaeon]
MQEYVEENGQRNALPTELFDDLVKRLESGTLRAAVKLLPNNGDTMLIGDLTGLRRFVFDGNDYDVLSLVVAEPIRRHYSRAAPVQTRNVNRTCPFEAVFTIQIFGYGEDKTKLAMVYSRAD